ncbi:hypothetical protein ACFQU9_38905 [Actinomadura namibiensis]|uniref:Uncharacterized protein n=2 Tax=Actinomadura TaxID=1988 RepID=A0A7W3QK60_ACTNM|nr:hypothetical protein [Actinomadura namibiensis]
MRAGFGFADGCGSGAGDAWRNAGMSMPGGVYPTIADTATPAPSTTTEETAASATRARSPRRGRAGRAVESGREGGG